MCGIDPTKTRKVETSDSVSKPRSRLIDGLDIMTSFYNLFLHNGYLPAPRRDMFLNPTISLPPGADPSKIGRSRLAPDAKNRCAPPTGRHCCPVGMTGARSRADLSYLLELFKLPQAQPFELFMAMVKTFHVYFIFCLHRPKRFKYPWPLIQAQ